MKRTYILLFVIQCIFFPISFNHGFGSETYIHICLHNQKKIRQIHNEHKRNWTKPLVLSKCSCSNNHPKKVTGHIKGITNCYVRIGFDTRPENDIICTPTQEFFVPALKKWFPAFQLKIGYKLLNKYHQQVPITQISLIPQSLEIYAIEVKDTHNYFVGRYAILTHNIPIPWAFSVGLSMSFGGGTTAGGILGLIGISSLTFCGGMAIGGLVGFSVYALTKNGLPQLNFEFDISQLREFVAYDGGPFPLADSSLYYKMDLEKNQYKEKNKNSKTCNFKSSPTTVSGGGDPRDPRNKGPQGNSKPPRNSNNNNHHNSEKKTSQRSLTNKEAREQAKKWGYTEDKNPPFYSHNKPAFKKGDYWITPDRDNHKGGVWKIIQRNGKRLATLDANLNPIAD